jgi:dihydrofolate synthase/folylpolyglutamate synthase
MMNYTEAVNWLYTQLPVYHRIGAAAYKADLNNTIKLCNHFGNPQHGFPSIHVAGTNGKGSTSHMLAAILQQAGYKVGLYTSPHLKSFTERIRINGVEIKEDFVTEFVEENKDFFHSFDPSFFEITVAMAFSYFNTEKVEVAVIETGLGGRLDSTNIITPIISVITNIGLDHQNLLGDTVEKIAMEKAGIIKPGVPVVIGEYQPEVAEVFINKAKEQDSAIIFASQVWEFQEAKMMVENGVTYQKIIYKDEDKTIEILTDQLGQYQKNNCRTVGVVVEQLKGLGFGKINKDAIQQGFRNTSTLTGLQGRWQILGTQPTMIADTGHNIDGIKQIVEQLGQQEFKQLRMIIGFVNDKSIREILDLLPRHAVYYFTQADLPRAMPAMELKKEADKAGLKGDFFTSTRSALEQAKKDASAADLIFIGGSTFVVAELI